ncbi:hypothetical protein M1M34_gp038 [Haloarcula tailed virus 2]|uniref:Uncharacterized protein n=1 Tax=Haloarcula tailed virus 2 TaxID=2877989 RepID=A0AAE8XZW1_9CAUD|nr:hypothetical protein M1M34_gp038 [Haloarcula tailed virus 2]UBF23189.1 hypothetical protein HATV-2_gp38 [Haloarcula tailed virus 2]
MFDEYDGGSAMLVLNGEKIPIKDFTIEAEVDYTSVLPMKHDKVEYTFTIEFEEQ